MIAGALAFSLVAALIAGLAVKIAVVCGVFLSVPALWFWMLTPAERNPFVYLLQRLKR
jgi:hypothetical protein